MFPSESATMQSQMRGVFAALIVLTLAACDNAASTAASAKKTAPVTAAKPAASKDWTTVVSKTPSGGFIMGNPDAPVKLLEFASLTCPHCKDFDAEAMATIKSKYVAPGKMSYEYRSFVLNGPDFAAALLARCQSPEAFFSLMEAFYANQASWTEPFMKLSTEETARLQKLSPEQQIGGLAAAGGLDGFMRTRGVPKAKFEACLNDKAAVEQLTAIRNEAVEKYKLTGTPTFVLNGETQTGVFNWASLQPKLQAAVK